METSIVKLLICHCHLLPAVVEMVSEVERKNEDTSSSIH